MIDTTRAYIAGFMTGRGGFGLNESGSVWLYFRTLDPEIAAAAREEWGGAVVESERAGTVSYKYAVRGERAARALEVLSPYLMGYKRERALEAGTLDDEPVTVCAAEDVLDLEETPAETLPPQEIPAAVAADTAARRAELAGITGEAG